jgi:hypothetical protein
MKANGKAKAKDVYLVVGHDGTPTAYTFATESRALREAEILNTTKITERLITGWIPVANNRPFRVEKYAYVPRHQKKKKKMRRIIQMPRLVAGE